MMEEEKKAPLTRAERQLNEIEKRMERLALLRGNDSIYDVKGYVYRENVGGERTALPPVTDFMEDDSLGRLYGSGKYLVNYRFIDPLTNDESKSVSFHYSIGAEYNQLHRDYCAQTGTPCYLDSRTMIPGQGLPSEGFLSSILNEDKIKGLAALVAVLKTVMGNNGSSDLKDILSENYKLLGIAIGGGKAQQKDNITERLLEASLAKVLKPENPRAQIREQLDFMKEMQELTRPAVFSGAQESTDEQEKESSPMDKVIGLAMEHLPAFLERFGNDERKAAQQVKKEYPAANLMLMSAKTRQSFYNALVAEHGQESADRWAQGFGIDPSKLRPQMQAPRQMVNVSEAIPL